MPNLKPTSTETKKAIGNYLKAFDRFAVLLHYRWIRRETLRLPGRA